MRIVAARDHAGFSAESGIIALLTQAGHDAMVLGVIGEVRPECPAYAAPFGGAIYAGSSQTALLRVMPPLCYKADVRLSAKICIQRGIQPGVTESRYPCTWKLGRLRRMSFTASLSA